MMVRIITKVAMMKARMEVMEPNALCCQIHDCLFLQMHQSINNRITLLKKENARKKSFFYQFITGHCTGDLKLIANMVTDLSPRGSPGCHLREDLVKAEKHFILFNVHCHCHSVFVSSSQFVPISINNTARTLYVAVTMQMIIILLSNIVNIFNHLELCPYADSVARPAIRTERSPPRRPC